MQEQAANQKRSLTFLGSFPDVPNSHERIHPKPEGKTAIGDAFSYWKIVCSGPLV